MLNSSDGSQFLFRRREGGTRAKNGHSSVSCNGRRELRRTHLEIGFPLLPSVSPDREFVRIEYNALHTMHLDAVT